MFTDMVRAAAAIDRVGKAREKRGLSDDPRDPKEVHVQEGIHPHPGPKSSRLARSNFLVRLMIGFMLVMLPNGSNADNSFPNMSNLCSGPWLCEEPRRQDNLPMSETNENRHKNGKCALQNHETPGCQASEVSERPAVQRDEQTAMCSQGILKDPLRPWWNASPTKDAEEEAEGSSPQRKASCFDDSKKKVSVQKNRRHARHGHHRPPKLHVSEVPGIDGPEKKVSAHSENNSRLDLKRTQRKTNLTDVKDPCDGLNA